MLQCSYNVARSLELLSRRNLLIRAAAGAALIRPLSAAMAKASQPATPVNFAVPNNACDCHVHVFGNPAKFPFSPSRTYTPELASIEELRALHRALHIGRVVIVQASVYGTDNSCTLDAIQQYGSEARGVAVIDDRTPPQALDDMHRGGIRGVRINLGVGDHNDPELARKRLQSVRQQINGRGWHVQIFTNLQVIAAIEQDVSAAGMPIVFDHFGAAKAPLGVQQPGFDSLLRLVRTGTAYVKLSGVYGVSSNAPDYADVAPLARALIAANPERVLWGTDWPHPDSSHKPGRKPTDIFPLFSIDDGRILNQLPLWAPEAQRKRILVDNPARLYGF